jgi:hypothetical protein
MRGDDGILVEGSGGMMIDKGKPNHSERNLPRCQFINRKSDLGLNPSLRSWKSTYNCLSYDTACQIMMRLLLHEDTKMSQKISLCWTQVRHQHFLILLV